MEKEMLAMAKFKSGEGKFEKFMGFMQSDEGMAVRKMFICLIGWIYTIYPLKVILLNIQ